MYIVQNCNSSQFNKLKIIDNTNTGKNSMLIFYEHRCFLMQHSRKQLSINIEIKLFVKAYIFENMGIAC